MMVDAHIANVLFERCGQVAHSYETEIGDNFIVAGRFLT